MNILNKIANSKYTLLVFIVLVAVWFSMWVFHITTIPESPLGAPDEGLRYLVPQFIFENWQLPTGYDAATIHTMGNWSYAFYPQFLGPLVSAGFMAVGSLFSSAPESLVHAARMASVLFGVLTVLFVGLSVQKLFKTNRNAKVYAFIAMLLVAAWPQVAFLSAYVNNDIVGLCGVSVIMYACISGYKDRWGSKNAAILAIGIVICLLGYINSYGFVLFAALFYVVSLWWQARSKMYFLKLVGIVAVIVLAVAGPFFARNLIIYNGDIFGLATFGERTKMWERNTGIEAQRNYTEVTGEGLGELIVDDYYRETQIESTVARFGKMKIAPDEKYAMVFVHTIQIGVIGFIWLFITKIVHMVRRRRKEKDVGSIASVFRYELLLVACIIAACVTTVSLSVYYSLNIDYQAQGRYVIYLLVPFIIASVLGFNFIINEVVRHKYRIIVALLLIGYYLITSLIIFYKYVFWVRVP